MVGVCASGVLQHSTSANRTRWSEDTERIFEVCSYRLLCTELPVSATHGAVLADVLRIEPLD